MAQPPAQPPTVLSTLLGFTAGNGATVMPAPTSTQTLPGAAPAVTSNASATIGLVGVDIVPFSFGLANANAPGTQIVTFPNLPYRNNTQNPLTPTLTAAQQPYSVGAINLLIFVAVIQSLAAPSGVVAGVTTQAIIQPKTVVPGPILGSAVYLTFQAVVSAVAPNGGAVSGTVIGLLFQSYG